MTRTITVAALLTFVCPPVVPSAEPGTGIVTAKLNSFVLWRSFSVNTNTRCNWSKSLHEERIALGLSQDRLIPFVHFAFLCASGLYAIKHIPLMIS